MTTPSSARSLARLLALNRTLAVVLLSVLFFGLGEQLWSQYMPLYLDAGAKEYAKQTGAFAGVSAGVLWTVGIYACLRNYFEGFCYIGGGQLTAWLGDRGSFLLFGALTVGGYALFLVSDHPAIAVIAALLILGWEPLSVPVTFTTVGSTVDEKRRGMAFAIQSIQKRLPKIIGPLIGGFVIASAAWLAADVARQRILAMQLLVLVALVLGVVSLVLQWFFMPHHKAPPPGPPMMTILRNLHPMLRRLLVAEIFTRWCDWLVREFIVLYVVIARGIDVKWYGVLLALQNVVALLTYLPIGNLTKTVGLQPFIGLTFIFFALFPLVLALVPNDWLWLAFVVYGLREIGEPARKALITSLMPEEVRARGVGLYWGTRAFALCTSSLAGAALWVAWGPEVLLYVAFALGCAGAAVFYGFARRPVSSPPVAG